MADQGSGTHVYGSVTSHGGSIFVGSQQFRAGVINFNPQHPSEHESLRDLYSTSPAAEKARLEAAEENLIDSYSWVLEEDCFKDWLSGERQILRISGTPGKGKTMMMIGILNHLERLISSSSERFEISYFFCRATDDRLSSCEAVLKGLLHHLLSQSRNKDLVHHLKERHGTGGRRAFEGPSAVFVLQQILLEILEDEPPDIKKFYFFIDALDECTEGQNDLLKLIRLTTSKSKKIRWLVSSRPNIDIDPFFQTVSYTSHFAINLEKYEGHLGIKLYIQTKVASLSQQKCYSSTETQEITNILLEKAEGTYLWVHIACNALEQALRSDAVRVLKEIPKGLEKLYKEMAARIQDITSRYGTSQKLSSSVLSITATAFRPLHLSELMVLMEVPKDEENTSELIRIIAKCGSFLILQHETVYFIHQSAKDYLEKQADATEKIDWHRNIAETCLRVLRKRLKSNICNLSDPAFRSQMISESQLSKISDLEYACKNWGNHVTQLSSRDIDFQSSLSSLVERFLDTNLLNWIELLSLLKGLRDGLLQITNLKVFYKQIPEALGMTHKTLPYNSRLFSSKAMEPAGTTLHMKLYNSERFMIESFPILETAPLQVYSSGLLFSPDDSWVKKNYSPELSDWIKTTPFTEHHWGSFLLDLRHESPIELMTISLDNSLIAAFSENGKLTIWDTQNGLRLLDNYDLWSTTISGGNKSNYRLDQARITPGNRALAFNLVPHYNSMNGLLTLCILDLSDQTWTYKHVPKVPEANPPEKGSVGLKPGAFGFPPRYRTYANLFLSNDGLICVGAYDNGVYLDTTDSVMTETQLTFKYHHTDVSVVEISPNKRFFASQSRNKIQIYDLEKNIIQDQITINMDFRFEGRMCFSQTESLLAASLKNSVLGYHYIGLWKIVDGICAQLGTYRVQEPLYHIDWLSFMVNESILLVNDGLTSKLIDTSSTNPGLPLETIRGRCLGVREGRLIFFPFGGESLTIMDLGNKERTILDIKASDAETFVLSNDGSRILGQSHGAIRLWKTELGPMDDLKSNSEKVKNDVFDHGPRSQSPTPNPRSSLSKYSRRLGLEIASLRKQFLPLHYKKQRGVKIHTLQEKTPNIAIEIEDISISGDGLTLAAAFGYSVMIWDLVNQRHTYTIQFDVQKKEDLYIVQRMLTAAFSRKGRKICIMSFLEELGSPIASRFAPFHQFTLLKLSRKPVVEPTTVFDCKPASREDGEIPLDQIIPHEDFDPSYEISQAFRSTAIFSPDDSIFAFSHGCFIGHWRIHSQKLIIRKTALSEEFMTARFLKDSNIVAFSNFNQILFYETTTGTILSTISFSIYGPIPSDFGNRYSEDRRFPTIHPPLLCKKDKCLGIRKSIAEFGQIFKDDRGSQRQIERDEMRGSNANITLNNQEIYFHGWRCKKKEPYLFYRDGWLWVGDQAFLYIPPLYRPAAISCFKKPPAGILSIAVIRHNGNVYSIDFDMVKLEKALGIPLTVYENECFCETLVPPEADLERGEGVAENTSSESDIIQLLGRKSSLSTHISIQRSRIA